MSDSSMIWLWTRRHTNRSTIFRDVTLASNAAWWRRHKSVPALKLVFWDDISNEWATLNVFYFILELPEMA
jgi:hypothetical protein